MGFGGILGQIPASGVPEFGLPTNDVRELPIKTGNTISAGDVVNVDGNNEVYVNVTSQKNVEYTISSALRPLKIRVDSCGKEAYVCAVMYDQSKQQSYLMLYKLSDDYTKAIASIELTRPSSSNLDDMICLNEKVVVILCGDQILWCQYDKNSNILSNIKTMESDGTGSLCRLSNTDFLYSYSDGLGLKARIVSIENKGQVYTMSSVDKNLIDFSSCRLLDDTNGNKRVCVCYKTNDTNRKGKATIVSIDQSNAITNGNEVDFNSRNTNNIIVRSNQDKILVAYTSGNSITGISLLANGKNIYLSTTTSLISTGGSFTISNSPINNGFLITSMQSNTYNQAVFVTIDNSGIKLSSLYRYSQYGQVVSSGTTETYRALLCYWNNNNDNLVATSLEVFGDQIAGSFIGRGKDAIALKSGNAGDTIPVGFGGYCNCPNITKGQTITSDGVKAYGVQDNWLDIIPAYRSTLGGGLN